MKKKNSDLGLERFREINQYAFNVITEQEEPENTEENPFGDEPNLDPSAAPVNMDSDVPMPGDVPDDEGESNEEDEDDTISPDETEEDDTTEEIDITDLVNMTKNIKKTIEDNAGKNLNVNNKMDDIFQKLGELETKLSEMDTIIARIDGIGQKMDQIKPKSPVEKLELRSLDSYPFNKKPAEFFDEKTREMRDSGKNDYVLTKGDVEGYGKHEVMKSFNPNAQENNNFNF